MRATVGACCPAIERRSTKSNMRSHTLGDDFLTVSTGLLAYSDRRTFPWDFGSTKAELCSRSYPSSRDSGVPDGCSSPLENIGLFWAESARVSLRKFDTLNEAPVATKHPSPPRSALAATQAPTDLRGCLAQSRSRFAKGVFFPRGAAPAFPIRTGGEFREEFVEAAEVVVPAESDSPLYEERGLRPGLFGAGKCRNTFPSVYTSPTGGLLCCDVDPEEAEFCVVVDGVRQKVRRDGEKAYAAIEAKKRHRSHFRELESSVPLGVEIVFTARETDQRSLHQTLSDASTTYSTSALPRGFDRSVFLTAPLRENSPTLAVRCCYAEADQDLTSTSNVGSCASLLGLRVCCPGRARVSISDARATIGGTPEPEPPAAPVCRIASDNAAMRLENVWPFNSFWRKGGGCSHDDKGPRKTPKFLSRRRNTPGVVGVHLGAELTEQADQRLSLPVHSARTYYDSFRDSEALQAMPESPTDLSFSSDHDATFTFSDVEDLSSSREDGLSFRLTNEAGAFAESMDSDKAELGHSKGLMGLMEKNGFFSPSAKVDSTVETPKFLGRGRSSDFSTEGSYNTASSSRQTQQEESALSLTSIIKRDSGSHSARKNTRFNDNIEVFEISPRKTKRPARRRRFQPSESLRSEVLVSSSFSAPTSPLFQPDLHSLEVISSLRSARSRKLALYQEWRTRRESLTRNFSLTNSASLTSGSLGNSSSLTCSDSHLQHWNILDHDSNIGQSLAREEFCLRFSPSHISEGTEEYFGIRNDCDSAVDEKDDGGDGDEPRELHGHGKTPMPASQSSTADSDTCCNLEETDAVRCAISYTERHLLRRKTSAVGLGISKPPDDDDAQQRPPADELNSSQSCSGLKSDTSISSITSSCGLFSRAPETSQYPHLSSSPQVHHNLPGPNEIATGPLRALVCDKPQTTCASAVARLTTPGAGSQQTDLPETATSRHSRSMLVKPLELFQFKRSSNKKYSSKDVENATRCASSRVDRWKRPRLFPARVRVKGARKQRGEIERGSWSI